MSELTTDDVIDTIEQNLPTAEVGESELAGGVRVTASDENTGQMFRLLRTELSDAEWQSKRDPSGNLEVHIEAEEAERGLGELFSR